MNRKELFYSFLLFSATIKAPSNTTFIIQEYHLPIYHTICAMLESAMFPNEEVHAVVTIAAKQFMTEKTK